VKRISIDVHLYVSFDFF